MVKYEKLTGEDATHVPIMKIGAYLDGYDKGMEILDKIIAEINVKKLNIRRINKYGRYRVSY
jgi:hypothetical protein